MNKKSIVWIIGLLILCSFAYADDLNLNLTHAWKFDGSTNYTDSIGLWNMTKSGTVGSGVGKYPVGSTSPYSTDVNGYLSTTQTYTSGNYSLCFWINRTGNSVYLSRATNGATHKNEHQIYFGSGNINFYGDALSCAKIDTMTNNTFNLICMNRGLKSIQGYVNGAEVCNANGTESTYTVETNLIGFYDRSANPNSWVIDEVYMWDRLLNVSEIATLYNGGAGTFYPFSSGGVTATIYFINQTPNNTYINNSAIVNFNANWNLTYPSNCSLYINSTLNQTKTGIVGNNTNSSFSQTFTDGYYSWFIMCKDNTSNVNSSIYTFNIDSSNPTYISNFVNNRLYYNTLLTGQWNLSDNDLIHSLNVSINNVNIFLNESINKATFQYNLSYNISNLTGQNQLYVRFADGHTAQEIDEYVVKQPIMDDWLQYEFKDEPGYIKIKGLPSTMFDTFTTEKQVDRYTIEYEPSDKSKTMYDFEVESDEYIDIIDAPNTKYKKWLITNGKWMDFETELSKYDSIDIQRISDNKVRVILNGVSLSEEGTLDFHSIGDLNVITLNYTFYAYNITTTYSSIVTELTSQTMTFLINYSGYPDGTSSAILNYNGSLKTVTKSSGIGYDYYTSTFTTPIYNANKNITFNWTYQIGNTTVNNTYSIQNTQTVTNIAMDNCSTYTTYALNVTMYNFSNNQIINTTMVGNLRLYYDDITNYKEFNLTWNQYNFSNSICISPASAAFNISGQLELSKYGLTGKQYYYITNMSLSNNTQLLNLYHTDGQTLVTITVYDENGNKVSNAYVSILIYDFATNTYVLSESQKTDSQGKIVTYLTLNTQWYKFLVIYNGIVYYESEPTKVITNTYSITITLGSDYFANYDTIDGVSCNIEYYNNSKCFSYTFTDLTSNVLTGCLDITRLTNSGSVLVNNSCVTASTSVINLCVTENTTNKNYIANGKITTSKGSFLCTSKSVTESSYYKSFGKEGLFMTFFLMLTLIMVGIWQPIIAVALAILALIASTMVGFFALSWGALVTIIILGVITVIRLNKR